MVTRCAPVVRNPARERHKENSGTSSRAVPLRPERHLVTFIASVPLPPYGYSRQRTAQVMCRFGPRRARRARSTTQVRLTGFGRSSPTTRPGPHLRTEGRPDHDQADRAQKTSRRRHPPWQADRRGLLED